MSAILELLVLLPAVKGAGHCTGPKHPASLLPCPALPCIIWQAAHARMQREPPEKRPADLLGVVCGSRGGATCCLAAWLYRPDSFPMERGTPPALLLRFRLDWRRTAGCTARRPTAACSVGGQGCWPQVKEAEAELERQEAAEHGRVERGGLAARAQVG